MNKFKWIGATAAIALMVVCGTISCRRSSPLNGPNCGIAHVKARKSSNITASRQEARPGSWPWMVTVHARWPLHDKTNICAGTVLSDKLILTQALCLGDDMRIVAGEHALDLPEESEQKRNVVEAIEAPSGWLTHSFSDIALLKLDEPLKFNERVAPICIAEKGAELELGLSTYITGWKLTGRQDPKKKHLDNVLQQGVVSIADCGKKYDKIFCVGGNSKYPCLGEGNTLIAEENGHHVLYGVMKVHNVSPECQYINVSYHRNWIDDTVKSMMQSD